MGTNALDDLTETNRQKNTGQMLYLPCTNATKKSRGQSSRFPSASDLGNTPLHGLEYARFGTGPIESRRSRNKRKKISWAPTVSIEPDEDISDYEYAPTLTGKKADKLKSCFRSGRSTANWWAQPTEEAKASKWTDVDEGPQVATTEYARWKALSFGTEERGTDSASATASLLASDQEKPKRQVGFTDSASALPLSTPKINPFSRKPTSPYPNAGRNMPQKQRQQQQTQTHGQSRTGTSSIPHSIKTGGFIPTVIGVDTMALGNQSGISVM